MKRFFAFILIILTSCAYQLEPPNKPHRMLYYHNVSSVLVVPFLDHTATPQLAQEVTESFTEELARFSEVGVIHATTVYEYLIRNEIVIDETNLAEVGFMLGRAFGVKAVILGAVTEYERYFPPILGISFEVITVEGRETVYAHSETFDSNMNYIRQKVKKYASLREKSDSVHGDEVILRKRDLFIRFVIHEIIKKHL